MDYKKKRRKRRSSDDSDDFYIIDKLVKTINNKSNKNNINLNKTENLIYKKIMKDIEYLPNIKDIVSSNTTYITKCELMEKLLMLDNLQNNTSEYNSLKKYIINELKQHNNIKKNDIKKHELIEKKLTISSDIPLKYKIISSNMTTFNLNFVYKKYLQYELSHGMSDNNKLLNQLNTYIKIPNTNKEIINSVDLLQTIKTNLDKEIYGLIDVKEQILINLNNMLSNPNHNNMNLALIGPQGVGKTAIANVLAKSIGIPFTQINLGGATDSSFLIGHSYTYEGSKQGIIVDSLIEMESKNGIIFFDELDKISKTTYGDDICKSLLHIIDQTQNSHFKDRYLGNFNIDLSKLWFIFSLNYEKELDKTLKDRLNIINIPGYTKKEKKAIALKFIIPKILKKINLSDKHIIFSDEIIDYIVSKTNKMYNYQTQDKNNLSGVRQLENSLQQIIYKLNLIINTNNFESFNGSFKLKKYEIPIKINIDILNELKIFLQEELYLPMYS